MIMANNFTARLNELYKKENTFSLESMMKRIKKMTPAQREARIAELKKKGGLENLNQEQLKIRIAELKEQNKHKE
jgi:hypothetical protein